jgi:hypothetical protein
MVTNTAVRNLGRAPAAREHQISRQGPEKSVMAITIPVGVFTGRNVFNSLSVHRFLLFLAVSMA